MSKLKYGNRYGQAVRDAFVDLVCSGVAIDDAAVRLGASARSGGYWWRKSGGMRIGLSGMGSDLVAAASDDDLRQGRFLSLPERLTIQVGLRQRWSLARIGREIGRDRSVVWREATRNVSPDGVYYATRAHLWARQARQRPKIPKLVANPQIAWFVEEAMDEGWSPKLISQVLAGMFPDDEEMRISHETIYRALYVQTRGVLRADLARQLSTKRTARRRRGSTRFSSPYRDAFRISERPAEVEDRAVPGHWEGDLIVGTASASAIGTLVERATRYTILLHLPDDHTAESVATAMIAAMKDLPADLRRTITWDRGSELADYRRVTAQLAAPVFFCDPHSPWQRGSNENTNRLLRHWFAKGTDLSVHTAADLKRVQNTLNARPRPTLNGQSPTQALARLLEAA